MAAIYDGYGWLLEIIDSVEPKRGIRTEGDTLEEAAITMEREFEIGRQLVQMVMGGQQKAKFIGE